MGIATRVHHSDEGMGHELWGIGPIGHRSYGGIDLMGHEPWTTSLMGHGPYVPRVLWGIGPTGHQSYRGIDPMGHGIRVLWVMSLIEHRCRTQNCALRTCFETRLNP